MADTEQKRTRRTVEERVAQVDLNIRTIEETIAKLENKKQAAVATYDEKIAVQQQRIVVLKAQKEKLLNPKPPKKHRMTKKEKMIALLKNAQKSGLSIEEMTTRLGLDNSQQ